MRKEDINMEYRSEKERKFEIVYRSYADDVYRACLYLTKDQKVAQDIAEQVFIEFYDSFETIKEKYMLAYLIRMVKDSVYYHQKSRREDL